MNHYIIKMLASATAKIMVKAREPAIANAAFDAGSSFAEGARVGEGLALTVGDGGELNNPSAGGAVVLGVMTNAMGSEQESSVRGVLLFLSP